MKLSKAYTVEWRVCIFLLCMCELIKETEVKHFKTNCTTKCFTFTQKRYILSRSQRGREKDKPNTSVIFILSKPYPNLESELLCIRSHHQLWEKEARTHTTKAMKFLINLRKYRQTIEIFIKFLGKIKVKENTYVHPNWHLRHRHHKIQSAVFHTACPLFASKTKNLSNLNINYLNNCKIDFDFWAGRQAGSYTQLYGKHSSQTS